MLGASDLVLRGFLEFHEDLAVQHRPVYAQTQAFRPSADDEAGCGQIDNCMTM